MKSKIFRRIAIIIIVIFIIFVINVVDVINRNENEKNITKICNININRDGMIEVEEKLSVGELYYFPEDYNRDIKFALYTDGFENLIEDVKVYIDGKEAEQIDLKEKLSENKTFRNLDDVRNVEINNSFYIENNKIIFYRIEPGNHIINVEYKINPKIISQYSNASILKIRNNSEFSDYKIKINFSGEVRTFKTDSIHAKVKKIENNLYEIDMTNTLKITDIQYTEIKLNKYIVKEPTIINQQYNIINKIASEKNFATKYLLILVLMTIFVFTVVKLLTIRRVIYKKHIKSTKVVLRPIFAESLIDGKIGAKELIMSCIMDLIYRKKIDVIEENEIIKIIDDNEMIKYERDIIDLVFDGKLTVSFQELKNKCNNKNESTKFLKKLQIIEDNINKYFFDEGIYSKIGEKLLAILKTVSLILALNFIPLTLSFAEFMEKDSIYAMIIIAFFVGIVFSNWRKINLRRKQKGRQYTNLFFVLEKMKFFIYAIFLGIIYIVILVSVFDSNIIKGLWAVLIIILNIISFKASQTHSLTDKGIKEYNKVYALKRYIKEYGLMEQREMDGIKVWDEYLIYACAFGISTKITGKIDEDALKINKFINNLEDYLIS